MPSTYTSNNALTLQAFNENPSTWGTIANDVFSLIDASLDGIEAIDVSGSTATATLTIADGASAPARARVLNFTGARSVTNVTVTIGPDTAKKIYWARNSTTGGFSVILAQGSGSTVTIAPGAWVLVFLNGAGSGASVTALSNISLAGSSSGMTTLQPSAAASGTLTLPAATDTLVGRATTDTLTNKTLDTAGAGNVLRINGTQVSAVTGTGSAVLATSPTLVTPNLGTPTSGTLTNCTGLPVSTGVSGLATGVAAFLATPTSANLAAALTDETGSGANVFATSPTLTTPTIVTSAVCPVVNGGTTASGTLTLQSTTGAGFTDAIIFRTGTQVERARITTSGNIGIGATSPDYQLQVNGENQTTAAITNSGNKGGSIMLFDSGAAGGNGGSVLFSAANSSGNFAFSAIKGLLVNGTGPVGDLAFSTRVNTGDTALTEHMRIVSVGNVCIGGNAVRATTAGSKVLHIFDGTAPVGTLANGCSFYSTSGEMRVMDAAGNATLLSPHDKTTNEWIYDSAHTPTGRRLKINVEKLLRFVNDHFGLDCVQDLIEE